MEILAQSKLIICNRKTPKELLVLSFFVFFVSCQTPVKTNQNKIKPEIAILKEIVTNRIKFEHDCFMTVAVGSSNTEVISILEGFKKYSENPIQLGTLRSLYGIENVFLKEDAQLISLTDSILNNKQYDFLLKQIRQNSKWSREIRKPLSKKGNINFNYGNYDIYISNPIFTKDKTLALVFVKFKSHSLVTIMGLRNKKWKELSHFAYMLY